MFAIITCDVFLLPLDGERSQPEIECRHTCREQNGKQEKDGGQNASAEREIVRDERAGTADEQCHRGLIVRGLQGEECHQEQRLRHIYI